MQQVTRCWNKRVALFSKCSPKSIHISFYLTSDVFKTAFKYLGYFYKKMFCQDLSKIAKSGRTGWQRMGNCVITWKDQLKSVTNGFNYVGRYQVTCVLVMQKYKFHLHFKKHQIKCLAKPENTHRWVKHHCTTGLQFYKVQLDCFTKYK